MHHRGRRPRTSLTLVARRQKCLKSGLNSSDILPTPQRNGPARTWRLRPAIRRSLSVQAKPARRGDNLHP